MLKDFFCSIVGILNLSICDKHCCLKRASIIDNLTKKYAWKSLKAKKHLNGKQLIQIVLHCAMQNDELIDWSCWVRQKESQDWI